MTAPDERVARGAIEPKPLGEMLHPARRTPTDEAAQPLESGGTVRRQIRAAEIGDTAAHLLPEIGMGGIVGVVEVLKDVGARSARARTVLGGEQVAGAEHQRQERGLRSLAAPPAREAATETRAVIETCARGVANAGA